MPAVFNEDVAMQMSKMAAAAASAESPLYFNTSQQHHNYHLYPQQQQQYSHFTSLRSSMSSAVAENSSPPTAIFNDDQDLTMTTDFFRGLLLTAGVECSRSSTPPDFAALNEESADAFELMRLAAAAGAYPTPHASGLHRKSQNTTECVVVPSSEHVAEIVGRQGCKIKALRAKTNTYIKTPVRGEDSVFVVTGRKDDVEAAKQEILSAAEHFTQIRASRRHSQGGIPAPGHITAYVRVPYKFVGLVVGPKGATIKRIQQQTHTYIITPSRDKEPVFEVTGLADNVEAARREIELHIGSRTGHLLPNAQAITQQPLAFSDGSAAGSEYDSISLQGALSCFEPQSRSASVLLSEFRSNGTETPYFDTAGQQPSATTGAANIGGGSGDSSVVSSLGALSSSVAAATSWFGAAIRKPTSILTDEGLESFADFIDASAAYRPTMIQPSSLANMFAKNGGTCSDSVRQQNIWGSLFP